MTITKRPPKEQADTFINAAPDAPKTIRKHGKQVVISFALPRDLLDRLDAAADEFGVSRAALIKLASNRLLRKDSMAELRLFFNDVAE